MRWSVIGASVRGDSHRLKGTPNQDAITWTPPDSPRGVAVLAVADGHGSARCFRSDVGSRFGATLGMRLLTEALTVEPATTREAVEAIPDRLLDAWREAVASDLQTNPLRPDELAPLDPGDASSVTNRPELAYGSTVVLVGATERHIAFVQLGDGDILVVSPGGAVTPALPDDPRLIANETTSLCTGTAADFRIHVEARDPERHAIVLASTDGYRNSFVDEHAFRQVGPDILGMLRDRGPTWVNEQFGAWLMKASQAGSGDDITLGLMFADVAAAPAASREPREAPRPTAPAPAPSPGPQPVSKTRVSRLVAVGIASLLIGGLLGWFAGNRGGATTTASPSTLLPSAATTGWSWDAGSGLLKVEGETPTRIVVTRARGEGRHGGGGARRELVGGHSGWHRVPRGSRGPGRAEPSPGRPWHHGRRGHDDRRCGVGVLRRRANDVPDRSREHEHVPFGPRPREFALRVGLDIERSVTDALVIGVGGREQTFDGTRDVTIGRLPDNDVVLEDHRISRRHATVTRRDGGWVYVDSSSKGSYRGAERVTELPLDQSVTLRLGDPNDGEAIELRSNRLPTTEKPPVAPRADAVAQGTTRIGRAPDNELVIADPLVSRHHADLNITAQGATLVDRGSHNGTFVNGARIKRVELQEGDVVSIGSRPMRFAGGRLVPVNDPDLQARDLTVRVSGSRTILDGVSIDIAPSSFVAIVGPSGSGKSTLLNALSGLVPATSGSVRFGPLDVYRSHDVLRRHVGYVPQEDVLHTQLPVRTALEYAAELRFAPDVKSAERTHRVQEVMQQLDIAERAALPIRQLSGGQRKRTSVALELLTKPGLMFLDEPTSGLDPANEEQLMDLLRSLADEGRIVVAITHSLQSLHRCDRVLFMAEGGQLAYYGPPDEALDHFRTLVPDVADLTDVFRAVEEHPELPWKQAFEQSPLYRKYAVGPERSTGAQPPVGLAGGRTKLAWSREFSVLTRRYISVIGADRGTALMLALQAPILGLLMLSAVGHENTFATSNGVKATFMIWLVALGATWLGASNSIREIVKERSILRRERFVGLSPSTYLASKVAVLGLITIAQCVVLATIALWRQTLPPIDDLSGKPLPALGPDYAIPQLPTLAGRGVVLGSQRIELLVVMCLVGLAAMTLGLAISAAVRSSDRALIWLPLILVAEVVASIPTFGANPVARVLGPISCTNWGTAAMGSTIDLGNIRAFSDWLTTGASTVFGKGVLSAGGTDARWIHDATQWWTSCLWLVALTLAGIGVAAYFLRSTRGRVGDE